MITLSDVLRKGAVGKIQITGRENNGKGGVCALGAIREGLKELGHTDASS